MHHITYENGTTTGECFNGFQIDILSSCYSDYGGIGIIGNIPRNFLTKLWSKTPIAVMVYDQTKRIKMYHERTGVIGNGFYFSKTTKLRVVLWVISDLMEFLNNNLHLQLHDWYDANGVILVIVPNSRIGRHYLSIYGNGDRRNVYVLSKYGETVALDGYNINRVVMPHPWKFLDNCFSFRGTLVVYRQSYTAGNEICKSLDYDQENDFAGHTMYIIIRTGLRDSVKIHSQSPIHIWSTTMRAMNATPKFVTNEILMNVVADDLCNFVYTFSYESISSNQYKTFFPIEHNVHRIIMQYGDMKSQLRKIVVDVFDVYSRCCICLGAVVTLIFFKFWSRLDFAHATLNVVRMMCNTGFTNLPGNSLQNQTRAFLSCLFVFIVTIQGIFSGNLASLLTTDIPIIKPTTMQDLYDLNYTVHTTFDIHLMYVPLFKSRIKVTSIKDCKNLMIHNAWIACVYDTTSALIIAKENMLYVSEFDIIPTYDYSMHKPEFPYVEKINYLLMRMSETRITQTLSERVFMNRLQERLSYWENSEPEPKVMTFANLQFAFVILGIGLTCATVAFIVEISIAPARPKIAKVRRYFRLKGTFNLFSLAYARLRRRRLSRVRPFTVKV